MEVYTVPIKWMDIHVQAMKEKKKPIKNMNVLLMSKTKKTV